MSLQSWGRRIKNWWYRPVTPTVLQMEALECGAAALGIILAYYGKYVPLEELRITCGVSRDGSNARNLLVAAQNYGLTAKGYKKEPGSLRQMVLPVIVHWDFNHFLVVEGFGADRVYLNDPACGRRSVKLEEFNRSFTGVVIAAGPGDGFVPDGEKPSVVASLRRRAGAAGAAISFLLLAGLALVVPGLVIPTCLRLFVDKVLLATRQDWLLPLLIGLGLSALTKAAFTWLREYYLLRLETKLAVRMSGQFFWQVLRLPLAFFQQRYLGDISSRIGLNDQVASLLGGQLAGAVLDMLLVGFYVILLFQYDGGLTLTGVGVALFNLLFLKYIARQRTDLNQRLLLERGKLSGASMNGLQTIESLKAGGYETDFFVHLQGQYTLTLQAEQEYTQSSQLLSHVTELVTGLNQMVILAAGGYKVMSGDLSIGMLVAFQSIMMNFLEPVNRLVALGGQLQAVTANLFRLDDVLKYPLEMSGTKAIAPAAVSKLSGRLEMKAVTFGYSRLDRPLVQQVSFMLSPGQRIALVGASGSGKSTVARLIAGLYQPWEGEIFLDGSPRSSYEPAQLSNSVAMVDQEIALFAGTIRENIALWDDSLPEYDLVQAAKDAAIHEDIAALPGGYDYLVEEGGRNFSGGQRQRLEIARALAQKPTLLILDEATSALDPVVEWAIYKNIRRRGCACLIVAHRLSAVRDCDEILVMQQGVIVQQGRHEELEAVDGLYRQLLLADAVPAGAEA